MSGKPTGNPWGPAITILKTVSGTPLYFNFHATKNDEDSTDKRVLGNTMFIGKSGTRKTVTMGFALAQMQKLRPTVVAFDKTIPGASTLGTGMYSVTATVAGCPGPAGTFSVTVFGIPGAPTLGSNSPLCEGQDILLTASNITGATYNWTGPNTFTSSVQNPTVTPTTTLSAGVYSVQGNVSGCNSPVATVTVTVNPTPAAPTATANSPLCEGQTLLLSASTVTGTTYSWTGPNSFTSTVQNPTITAATTAASGTYSVSVNVSGCGSAASTIAVVVNPTPAAPMQEVIHLYAQVKRLT